jgi:hypothetical protein
MLGFGVYAVDRNNKIRVLILRGIYDIVDIRIGKIIFHNYLYYFELSFQCR